MRTVGTLGILAMMSACGGAPFTNAEGVVESPIVSDDAAIVTATDDAAVEASPDNLAEQVRDAAIDVHMAPTPDGEATESAAPDAGKEDAAPEAAMADVATDTHTTPSTCSSTCSGCCDSTGICQPGTSDDSNCGSGGNACTACGSGKACIGSDCVTASDPPTDASADAAAARAHCAATCSGCCDTNGICQPGQAALACGIGGSACVNCFSLPAKVTGGYCVADAGTCTPPVDAGSCAPSSCPACSSGTPCCKSAPDGCGCSPIVGICQ